MVKKMRKEGLEREKEDEDARAHCNDINDSPETPEEIQRPGEAKEKILPHV